MKAAIILFAYIANVIYMPCSAASTDDPSQGEVKTHVPYVVSIQMDSKGIYQNICVGTIISESVVLTSGSCLGYVDVKNLTVTGGSKRMSTSENLKRYKVEQIEKNQYFFGMLGDDVALLKMAKPFSLNNVTFSKVDYETDLKQDNLDNVNGFMLSWGYLSAHEKKILNLVPFRILSQWNCMKNTWRYVKNSVMCAEAFGFRGPCERDSGSPLVSSDLKVLLGVLAKGNPRCDNDRSYVFTRISSKRSWIERTLKKWGLKN